METGQIVITIPVPVVLVTPAIIVFLFALVRGLLDVLPL